MKMKPAFALALPFLVFCTTLSAQTPTITNVNPASGTTVPGATVTITGTNFNTTAASNIVRFGAVKAMVTAASATSLTVTAPVGATYAPVTALNTALARAGTSLKPFLPTFAGKGSITLNDLMPKVDFTAAASARSVAIGDLDGDGKPDLAVANTTDNTVSVFRNTSASGSITASSFATKVDFATGSGSSPYSVAIGDLDGDGKLDLAVAKNRQDVVSGNYTVSIFRNTSVSGSISFAAKVDFTAGVGPSSIAIGDLDGDGKPDLAVANNRQDVVSGNYTVSIFRNTSISGNITTSSFAAKVDFTSGFFPNSVAIGDLDGDGKPDLAVTCRGTTGSGSLSVLRNTSVSGSSSFDAKVEFNTENRPYSVAVGDLDGDGKPDLVVANYNSLNVSVFRNTSTSGNITTSSFANKVNFSTNNTTACVAIGDMDGDGKPDLVAANQNLSNVSVMRNTSVSGNITASSFATKVDFPTGNIVNGVAIGDLDGDGKPDLALACSNEVTGSLTVLRNNPSTLLIFNANGGTGSMANQRISYQASANLTANAFTRTGYNFAGWNTAADGTGTSYSNSQGYTIGATDVTLYAQWLLLPPTITNISPATGLTVPGATVTLTGTNFNTTAANNIVRFGAVKASVSAATATSLTVTAPVGATYAQVTALNTVLAMAGTSPKPFLPSFAGKGSFTANDMMAAVEFNPIAQCSTFVALGDLDGDGKPDLVTVSSCNNTISVFRNISVSGTIGATSFASKVDFATGSSPNFLAIGDLDGDGKLDLAVANFGGSTVSVFRNTSASGVINASSFAAKVDFATGTNPIGLAIGDLDGDGKPDLVTANQNGNSLSVLRNTSASGTITSSSFAAGVDFAMVTGSFPRSVAIGDLDGDGKPDLAVGNFGANTVSVFRNTSSQGIINTGSFAAQVNFATATSSRAVSVAIGDLDGDGKPDLAVANSYTSPVGNAVSVLRNTSSSGSITTASFAAKVDLIAATRSTSVAIGDLDGDGKPDLVVTNNSGGGVSVCRNVSSSGVITSASFATNIDFTVGDLKMNVVIGDLDGDGKPDIVGTKYVFNATSSPCIYIFRNNPSGPAITNISPASGTTVPGATVTLTGTNFNTTAASNIVHFGAVKATVTAATATSLTVTAPAGATYAPVIALNANLALSGSSTKPFLPTFAGKGSFTFNDILPKVDFATGTTPYSVAIGDLDGDGKPDLVVANEGSASVSVFRNISVSGSITASSFAAKVDFATGANPVKVSIGDLDCDGKPDLVVVNVSSTVSVLRNTSASGSISASSFAAKVDFTTGFIPVSVAIGDLDGDGRPDLAVANNGASTVSVLRNTSAGGSISASSFSAKVDFTTGLSPHSVAIGDLDGDGKLDLAVTNQGSTTAVSVFHNTSVAGSITATSFAAKVDFTTGASARSLAIGDLDGDGKADLVVGNFNSNSVSVFRNTSVSGSITASSFAAKVDFTTGLNPISVAIGDMDGDGKPDMAVANQGSTLVSVFRNTSVSGTITTSSFAAKVDFTTGANPQSIAIGDLDGDGKPDFVAANYNNASISLFRNNPSGLISFDVNGGTGTMANQQISYLASANLTANAFTRPGYTFAGWNTLASGAGTSYANSASYTMGASNVTLYAKWTANTLAVTYNSQLGSAIANGTTTTGASISASPGTPTRVGYTFNGWFAATTGGTAITFPCAHGQTANFTLYAQWTANTLAVTYNSQLGSAIASGTTTTGASISASPGIPTRTGYTFNGWFAAATGGTAITFPYTHGQTANFTLYAQWTANTLAVTYNSQLGSAIASGTTTTGASISASPGTPTRAGYTFNGWFAATTGGTVITFPYTHGQTANFALYAQWTANTLTVTYNSQLGSAIASGTTTTGTSISASPGTPTRTGYTFTGWFVAATGGTTITFPYTHGQTANFTLYAQWLLIPPVINSISPAIGTTVPGATVTITGTNFNPTAANNIVHFGAVKATVTAASATSLTVTAPVSATYAPVTALNTALNLVGTSPKPFLPTFSGKGSFTVNDIMPKVDFVSGTNPSSVAIGDLDGDGKPDLVVANSTAGSDKVSVFRNTSVSGSLTPSSFAARVDFFMSGSQPSSVAIGDLDGDGKPELVVANSVGASVSVFRNTATTGVITTGSFAARVNYGAGSVPQSVAIGDLDGDGKPELVVANSNSANVSVLRNTSTSGSINASSFAAKVNFATGAFPISVAIGDLDGDSKPELAVAAYPGVSVLRNTSVIGSINASSFAAKVDFVGALDPVSVAISDVDGDSKPDLAVASYFYGFSYDNKVSILRNTTASAGIDASSFAAKVDFISGTGPTSVSFGDLDGDGKPDLVVANSIFGNISVFRNISMSGNITASSFAAKVDFPAGSANEVAIGDLDGDGKADLALASGSGTVSVLHINPSAFVSFNANVGTGTMANQKISYLASANLTANAFTRTGYTFFRWNTAADGTGTSYANSASYTMGASDVTLYAQWLLIPPVITNISPATGLTVPGATVTITGTNFNPTAANNIVHFGAVKATVTAASATSLTVTAPVGATYAPVTVFNTGLPLSGSSSKPFLPTFAGKGSFTKDDIMPKVDFATTGTQQPYYVAIGDIDGDGKPDLAVANYANGTVSVYHNTSTSGSISTASFAARVDFATGANPISVAIGDLNGDGKPELAVTNNGSASVSVFRNTASSGSITTASFAAKVDYTVGTNPRSVAIVDLDRDGKADLAVANTAVFTVSVLRNTSATGTISFLPKVDYASGANPHFVAFGDLDGDGKPDLATANNGNASVSVLRNNSIAGTIALEAKVDFTAGAAPVSLAIGDLDADGKAEMVVTNFGNAGISVFKNNAVSGAINSTSFAAKVDFTTGTGAWSVAIGDLDGDGKPDLAVANTGVTRVSVLRNTSTASSITTSSFAAKVDFATATGTRSVAIGDLDGDGKPDFVAANYNNATISVFRNNPSAFVSFNANVGTGTMANQKISYLASANLTANAFTRTGYTFSGWNTAADGTGISYANLASYTMGASDVTLFAQWSINNYNITFDGNAADGGSMSSITIVYTGSANLTPNGFTRTGYTFAGWATSAAGVVVYADFANYTMGAADVTLYAKWTINNYVISYDANGGTGSMLNQTLVYNTSAALRNNTITRTGYTFTGWNTAANGSGTAYANSASYTMGATDVTMYAQWSINDYTITYDGNGSSAGSMSAQTNPYNTIFNFTANGFIRTGYVFYGWNTEANGTGTAFTNLASYTMGASDVTLYAQWVICTWTGASNGNWNDASNWNAYQVPTGGIDVVIPAGTVNAISTGGSFSSKSVTIQAGATVGINSGGVWNIVGNLQGAAGSVITGTGKVVLNGSSAQTISGTVSVSNLEIDNSAVQITTGSSLSILPTASSLNALLTLLSGSSLTNNGNLILRSNSFGTGSIGPIPANATLGGNITQERLLPSTKGWYFVGAPFKSGSTLSEWSELNPRISPKLNGTLFEYSESDSSVGVASEVNGWKVPNTLASAINPSNQPKGYRIYVGVSNPTRLISATGLPFTQDVVSPLTFSPLTGYGGGGWNLISNPYPCAINWNQMRNDASNSGQSLSNAYYTWNGTAGNYGSYTSLGAGTGVGVGGLQESISSSQAFFVKATGTSSLTFKESFKNTGAASSSFLRTATTELEFLKFKVQQGINWDEAGVLFYPGAEEGEDIYDALNLMGSAVDVAMVMTGGKNASIGVLPAIGDQRVIPLKVRTPSNGQATFHFEGIDHFSPMIQLYLKDEYLGTLTDIRQHPDVSFESVAAQSYNRFSLVLLTINLRVETENVDKKALRIFPNPAQTTATVFSPMEGNLTIFNALGQKVQTQSVVNGQNHLDISRLPQGMYWIKMQGMAEEKLVVE